MSQSQAMFIFNRPMRVEKISSANHSAEKSEAWKFCFLSDATFVSDKNIMNPILSKKDVSKAWVTKVCELSCNSNRKKFLIKKSQN